MRCVLGVLGLISLQVRGFLPPSLAMTVPDLSDSPRPDRKYTLFVELNQPYESNRVALQKMLKTEGYESFSEGERELSLVLTAEQIAKLFQARLRFRKVEASASPGTGTQPVGRTPRTANAGAGGDTTGHHHAPHASDQRVRSHGRVSNISGQKPQIALKALQTNRCKSIT